MEEYSSAVRKTWQGLCFGKKTILWLDLNEATKTLNPLSAELKGKVDPCRWSKDKKKGGGTNSEKSGTRNLAA